MFSVLEHHPASSVRFEAADNIPASVPRDFGARQTMQHTQAVADYAVAEPTGRFSYKYRSRPLAVTVSGEEDQLRATYALVKFAEAAPTQEMEAGEQNVAESKTRTVFVQTDYRCVSVAVLCSCVRSYSCF